MNDTHITIRIPEDLKEKLKRQADREHRSLSNLIKKYLYEKTQEQDR